MKTKIICPIDFTDPANNASEYTAMLAQVTNAELMLLNVQHIHFDTAVSLGAGIASDTRNNTLKVSNKLKQISVEINKLCNIPTTYEVDITTKSLSKTIASAVTRNTMIVMGTTGPENLKRFFWGTNTYKARMKSECPFLIVPKDISFEKYKNIFYPIIVDKKDKMALEQFYEFAKFFEAQITFHYLTKQDTEKSQKAFRGIKEEIKHSLDGKLKYTFTRAFTDNIDDALDDFIFENQTNMLMMEERHRNIPESFFPKKNTISNIKRNSNISNFCSSSLISTYLKLPSK